MKKLLIASALTFTLLSAGATSTYAQYYTPGSSPSPSEIFINKMVKNPQNGVMVDNLGVNDPRFTPGQEVVFQIQVVNTGDNDLTNLTVKDQLPSFVNFEAGPGNFDSGSQVLTFNIDSLAVNETKTFEVKVNVKGSDQVPTNQVTCIANSATVSVNDLSSQDTAQFCFENNVPGQPGVTNLPTTGPVLPGVTSLPKTGVADTIAVLAMTLSSFLAAAYIWAKKAFN